MSKGYDPIALEILKMARELVINEYTDRRAQDHNKWLADFEVVWKNNRVRLPYPDIPPYPTETEIVTRAQTLMRFLHQNQVLSEEAREESVKNTVLPETIASQYVETPPIPVEEIDTFVHEDIVPHAPDVTAAGILPSIMKKLKM